MNRYKCIIKFASMNQPKKILFLNEIQAKSYAPKNNFFMNIIVLKIGLILASGTNWRHATNWQWWMGFRLFRLRSYFQKILFLNEIQAKPYAPKNNFFMNIII